MIGVLLAGGRGSRLHGAPRGAKALAPLGGRPLICHPLAALLAVTGEVAVVAKPATELPELPGVEVWREPESPHHPLVGIVEALRRAGGRAVLVCAADLPFVTVEVLGALARADPAGAPAVLAVSPARGLQPLVGCYQPVAEGLLAADAAAGTVAVRAAVRAIGARKLQVGDERAFFNVNTPQDLARAEEMLAGA